MVKYRSKGLLTCTLDVQSHQVADDKDDRKARWRYDRVMSTAGELDDSFQFHIDARSKHRWGEEYKDYGYNIYCDSVIRILSCWHHTLDGGRLVFKMVGTHFFKLTIVKPMLSTVWSQWLLLPEFIDTRLTVGSDQERYHEPSLSYPKLPCMDSGESEVERISDKSSHQRWIIVVELEVGLFWHNRRWESSQDQLLAQDLCLRRKFFQCSSRQFTS